MEKPNPFGLLRDAVALWMERDAFQHAAALAFFTLFSLAPLVILLVAIVGAFYGEEAARGEISSGLQGLLGAQAAGAVEEAVRRSRPEVAGLLPTIMGVGALIFGATTVFAQMQASLNHFWGVRARPSRSGVLNFITVRLLSLGMVLVIGFLLLTSFALSVAVNAIVEYAGNWIAIPGVLVMGLDILVSLMVTAVLLGLVFKVLPDVRLQWRDVRYGALATAVLFVLGQYLITLYLSKMAPASAFGAAGSLVLVLLWIYYSSLILFFGTALTCVAIRQRGSEVIPRATAVRVSISVREQ